jgi:hypothetical protein
MVKKIELTQNQVALVDDEDYEFLNQNKWHAAYDNKVKGFYARRKEYIVMFNGERKGKTINMHRVIMGRVLDRELKRTEVIDHINHNICDNRRKNLRMVSNRQNMQNQKRKTTSKYPGVYWNKAIKKWMAYIQLNGKLKHLGVFTDEREAAKAYERACRELVGEELVCKTAGVV